MSCNICKGSLSQSTPIQWSNIQEKDINFKTNTFTTCGHLFHAFCVFTRMEFGLDSCPKCEAKFEKKKFKQQTVDTEKDVSTAVFFDQPHTTGADLSLPHRSESKDINAVVFFDQSHTTGADLHLPH